jgi:hypothetical protein
MRNLIAILAALAVGGAAGAYLPDLIAGSRAQGIDVLCLQASSGTICKGQSVTKIPWNWENAFGGIVFVACDFVRAGEAKESGFLLDIPSIAAGCKANRYVVSLSDGAVQTNFWIANGLIVQIDRFEANPIDF